MRFLLLSILFICFSNLCYSYNKICLQSSQSGRCIEYWENGPTINWRDYNIKLSDLNPSGITYYDYRPPKVEVTRTKESNPSRSSLIEQGLEHYGTGISKVLSCASHSVVKVQLASKNTSRTLGEIRNTIKSLARKNNVAANKLRDSYKDFKSVISNKIDESYRKIDEINEQLEKNQEELNSSKIKESESLAVDNLYQTSNIVEIEFRRTDDLISSKRSRLLKYENKALSRDTIDQIYQTSGQVQVYANEAFKEKDYETASIGQEIALDMLDVGLGVIPFVGDGLSFVNAISGKNTVTGKKLSTDERVLEVVVGIVGIASFGTLGGVSRTAIKSGKLFKKSDKLVKIFDKGKEVVVSARKFIKEVTPDAVKDFALTTQKILGNNIGAVGKLDELVESSTELAKKLKFTATTTQRMENVNRHVPVNMLATAIKYGKEVPDPQGAVGAMQYTIEMFKNGKKYNLDVVYREADNTILHFLYK